MEAIVRSAIERHLYLEQRNRAPEGDAPLHEITRKMSAKQRAEYKREIKAIQTER